MGGVVGAQSGCAHAQPVGFSEDTPTGRIRATLRVAEQAERSAIPDLVEQLDADDPLVRMLAQRTLERLTGQTLGYHHAAPPHEREEAIERWVAWVRAEGLASTRGAAATAEGSEAEPELSRGGS